METQEIIKQLEELKLLFDGYLPIDYHITLDEAIRKLKQHDEQIEHAKEQGRKEERKKIMEICDESDDIANVMYNLTWYIVDKAVKEDE